MAMSRDERYRMAQELLRLIFYPELSGPAAETGIQQNTILPVEARKDTPHSAPVESERAPGSRRSSEKDVEEKSGTGSSESSEKTAMDSCQERDKICLRCFGLWKKTDSGRGGCP